MNPTACPECLGQPRPHPGLDPGLCESHEAQAMRAATERVERVYAKLRAARGDFRLDPRQSPFNRNHFYMDASWSHDGCIFKVSTRLLGYLVEAVAEFLEVVDRSTNVEAGGAP